MKARWDMVTNGRKPEYSLEKCLPALLDILKADQQPPWGTKAVFQYNSQFPQRLRELHHPVMLLNPGDELHAVTSKTTQYLQNVTLIDLPDWGHGYLEVHTQETVNMLNPWLNEGLLAPTKKLASGI